jgi:hypothetical protein
MRGFCDVTDLVVIRTASDGQTRHEPDFNVRDHAWETG